MQFFAVLLVVLLPLTAAQSNSRSCDGRVAQCNGAMDYFPTKLSFDYATTVKSLTYFNTYALLDMAWNDYAGPNAIKYALVQCGCPSPKLGPSVREIYVPVSSSLVEETVAVPKILLIGQGSKITAVHGQPRLRTPIPPWYTVLLYSPIPVAHGHEVTYTTSPELLDAVKNKLVVDIEGNYSKLQPIPARDRPMMASSCLRADPHLGYRARLQETPLVRRRWWKYKIPPRG